MFESLKKMFGGDPLAALQEKVGEINDLEKDIGILGDLDIKERSLKLKEQVRADPAFPADPKKALDEVLVEAFALVREAAKRTLGQRPFDVQLLGGLVLHQGAVAEMMTGEGKTLAAVAPAYLNALAGRGVHVVTVNEYLARRDAVWMGQIYQALGLSVSCLVPNAAYLYDPDFTADKNADKDADKSLKEKNQRKISVPTSEKSAVNPLESAFLVQQEFLRPISRREAYKADITYGTNHEFGFDYLRDNLAYQIEGQAQTGARGGDGHFFAIIDEVDSILIDEARTPLIIAAPDAVSSDAYKTFARVAAALKPEEDYEVDEKRKSAMITDAGAQKVEKMIGVPNLYAPENIRLVHYLEESVKAQALFHRDKEYVVRNGEIIIVDEFTGRMLQGRRYQAGLHQAIEAKEGVAVKDESRTYAKISVQNYFRMYKKISGMTGTAQTSAEEFHKVYQLEVVSIPPNRPLARRDQNDLIYKSFAAKVDAVVKEVAGRQKKGQPVLLGTTSIAKNEIFSAALSQAAIKHEVLNAKNNEREGAIIAQAGRPGAVTVATNVAGRGVDILLGGNPASAAEAGQVRQLGGLHVIGTERHEARRIDNQLRGRAGRQGDPGSTQFFLSLEDDLMRIFGGERMKSLMERFDLPDDQPIEFKMVTNAVAQAQEKVEGANFDLRKHLLEYDDVLNKQRAAVYKKRNEILRVSDIKDIADIIKNAVLAHFDSIFGNLENFEEQKVEIEKVFKEVGISTISTISIPQYPTIDGYRNLLEQKSAEIAENPMARNQLLSVLDLLWMTNLEDLEALSESVGLRAYGQKDPLVEYRQEASRLFKVFWKNYNGLVFSNIFRIGAAGQGTASAQNQAAKNSNPVSIVQPSNPSGKKIGRNDKCFCGSGKKWKHCGLINTEEHQKNTAGGGKKHEATGG